MLAITIPLDWAKLDSCQKCFASYHQPKLFLPPCLTRCVIGYKVVPVEGELHLPFINMVFPQFLLKSGLIERLDRLVILYGCEWRSRERVVKSIRTKQLHQAAL